MAFFIFAKMQNFAVPYNCSFCDNFCATRPSIPFLRKISQKSSNYFREIFGKKSSKFSHIFEKPEEDPNSRNVYSFLLLLFLKGQTSYTEYRRESGLNEKSEQRQEVLTAQYTEKMIRLRTEEDWTFKKM